MDVDSGLDDQHRDQHAPGDGESLVWRLQRIEEMVQQVWDRQERDSSDIGPLATRLSKFEGAFESSWAAIRRLHGQVADLAKRIDDHEAALDVLGACPESAAEPAGDSGDQLETRNLSERDAQHDTAEGGDASGSSSGRSSARQSETDEAGPAHHWVSFDDDFDNL